MDFGALVAAAVVAVLVTVFAGYVLRCLFVLLIGITGFAVHYGPLAAAGFAAGLVMAAIGSEHRKPVPPAPIDEPLPADNDREMYIAADGDHQCFADVWLKGPNGRETKYSSLLDTGAAGKVILNRAQAAALGFDVARLSYDYRVDTANGTGKAARVQLAQFRMGGRVNGYRLANVETWVNYNGASSPLIGAEILKTLNFQIREGSCSVTLPAAKTAER